MFSLLIPPGDKDTEHNQLQRKHGHNEQQGKLLSKVLEPWKLEPWKLEPRKLETMDAGTMDAGATVTR